MKTIKFNWLIVSDFKGIDRKEIDFSSGVTVISGPNRSRKTSLLDAIYWVLFGKTLIGDTRFGIMPLGMPHATPYVELALNVDGSDHSLVRKIINGATDCMIDGVPTKVRDYEQWVDINIMQIERFKLFSNPLYFASLSWQEQRSTLTGFFENLPREDVLSLMQRSGKETSTEYRIRSEKQKPEDMIEAMKREIKDLDTQKSKDQGAAEYIAKEIAALGSIDTSALEAEREKLLKQFDEAEKIAKDAESARSTIDGERRIKRGFEVEADSIRDIIRKNNREKETQIASVQRLIKETEAKIQRKAIEWRDAQARPVTTDCPTCGHPFAPDKISDGEYAKARVIAGINADGKALRDELKDHEAMLAEINGMKVSSDLMRSLVEKEGLIKEQEQIIALLEIDMQDVTSIASISDIRRRLDDIGKEIAQAAKLDDKKADRDALNAKIQKAVFGIEIRERVKKDAENFIQYRAMATVDAVNSQFDRVKIELFDFPKNGEPKPTFKLLFDGVNFGDTSSTERVLIGMEINEYLKAAVGVSVPTIIDNFESYKSIGFDALPKQSIVSVVTGGKELQIESII